MSDEKKYETEAVCTLNTYHECYHRTYMRECGLNTDPNDSFHKSQCNYRTIAKDPDNFCKKES